MNSAMHMVLKQHATRIVPGDFSRQVIKLLCLCGMLLSLPGCGAKFEANVAGKVTQGGQPLSKGSVSFHPVGGGPVGIGMIEADGSYSIRTGTGAGLPPGDYLVTVVASEPPPPGDEESAGKLLTPPEYGDVRRTPLKYTVERGASTIDLEVPAGGAGRIE